MMSTRVTDANAFKELAEDIVLDAEGVTQYYQDFAGCKNVYIFPRMPYEGTGHIDMWAKFLDDETLIVGELRDEILGLESYSSSDLRKVQSLKNYLDERAKEIQALGFKVIRLPMPAPLLADQDVFRSYTNSLTLNGKVLVPRYLKPAYASMTADGQYPDAQYISAYEAEVRDTYERLGYTFIWVDSDNLIADGGAVHCTTMQIAK
jgi:agmatine/peptidylarginine deiminase